MSRRAQIAGQVFIYVMGIVIISLVVIFGYKAIIEAINRSHELELVDFKSRLTKAIEEMTLEYGSVQNRDFALPTGFSKICFVNATKEPATKNICIGPSPNNPDFEPIVCNYWTGKSRENAFLLGKNTEAFFIGDEDRNQPYLSVAAKGTTNPADEDYLCPKVTNSRIKLRIEGKGKYAEISQG
jgi:hypothetical protein